MNSNSVDEKEQEGETSSILTPDHVFSAPGSTALAATVSIRTPTKRLAKPTQKAMALKEKAAIVPKVTKVDRNRCNICKISHDSEEDKNLGYPWVKCTTARCNFWVHAGCTHIYYENSPQGVKCLDNWSKDHFYCKLHMPRQNVESSSSEEEDNVVKFINHGKVIKKSQKEREYALVRKYIKL